MARIQRGLEGSSAFTGGVRKAGVVVVPNNSKPTGLPLEDGLVQRTSLRSNKTPAWLQPPNAPSVVPAHALRWREREAYRIERENAKLHQTLTQCGPTLSANSPTKKAMEPTGSINRRRDARRIAQANSQLSQRLLAVARRDDLLLRVRSSETSVFHHALLDSSRLTLHVREGTNSDTSCADQV